MSKRSIVLNDAVYAYFQSVSLREPDVLKRLREETATLPHSSMQISPEQGQLMGFLVRLMGARRALEVGVFTGYSSLSVALALPDDGALVACDRSTEWTSIARRYWEAAGVANKIELRLGPGLETLDGLLEEGAAGSFDFAFIDADKANYPAYVERCHALLRAGGVIGIDNVLWGGRLVNPDEQGPDAQAIRNLNAALREDDRFDLTMVPIGDGLTLLRKR